MLFSEDFPSWTKPWSFVALSLGNEKILDVGCRRTWVESVRGRTKSTSADAAIGQILSRGKAMKFDARRPTVLVAYGSWFMVRRRRQLRTFSPQRLFGAKLKRREKLPHSSIACVSDIL